MNYNKILIHTFLTEGFMGWGELFLESLRIHHGEAIRVRVDGCNLTNDNIALLKKIYSNIEVHNKLIDMDAAASECNVSLNTFHEWRESIERGEVTPTNYLYKIFISVNQRYRNMDKVIDYARESGYGLLLHSDADIYFRDSMDNLFEIIENHDFTILFRDRQEHRLKVLGGLLGFNLNNNIDHFIEIWMSEIDKVPFKERWMGFGQSVLWFALQKCNELDVADLGTIDKAPKFSKAFEAEKEIWLGNSKVIKPVKYNALYRCWTDLKNELPRIPLSDEIAQNRYLEMKIKALGLGSKILNKLFSKIT